MTSTAQAGISRYRTRPIEISGLGLDGKQEAEPGDWIVCDEDGVFDVFSDTAFHAEFEAAVDA